MERDHRDYLRDALEAMNDISGFIRGMDFRAFAQDRKTINAAVRSLEVIGEAVKKIPDDLKTRYPEIPWKHMAAMRDKLIHEYFGVDTEIVWKVVSEELVPLRPLFEEMLGKEQG